jgi:hypothetical protein
MAQILGNQPPQPRLDWSQAQDFTCSHCGSEYFINAVMIKKFSKLVTGTPKDAVIPVDILMCGNCGKPVDELIPAEIRKNKQTTEENNPASQNNESSLTLEL